VNLDETWDLLLQWRLQVDAVGERGMPKGVEP
jgi:hypothetical protein